jgi:1-deoxyxylulose-5-phosphate synthase
VEYRRLGNTGTVVSAICLGCLSFGDSSRGAHPWTLDEESSRALIRQALESGINFFDTGNVYSDGTSEEFVGRALRDFADRDEIVLATKVYNPMRPGPNGRGLSRKAIFAEIDNSLRRLGVDYVDLYQIHRWDNATPIEETLDALHDVVKAGKARYIGASSTDAWQFAKALYTSDLHGWVRFVSMQTHYNLLFREEEREMIPLCADQGIALNPWSPLARGRLTRPWDASSARAETDDFSKGLTYLETDRLIVGRLTEVAQRHGVTRAEVALAWLLQNPAVTSPIVGVTSSAHLTDAVSSIDLHLDEDEVKDLESAYRAHDIAGFR